MAELRYTGDPSGSTLRKIKDMSIPSSEIPKESRPLPSQYTQAQPTQPLSPQGSTTPSIKFTGDPTGINNTTTPTVSTTPVATTPTEVPQVTPTKQPRPSQVVQETQPTQAGVDPNLAPTFRVPTAEVAPEEAPETYTYGERFTAEAIPESPGLTPRARLRNEEQTRLIVEQLQRGQLRIGSDAYNKLQQNSPRELAQAMAIQESVQIHQNMTGDQLFEAIKRGSITPDPNNALWNAMYQNGEATPAMKDAFKKWETYIQENPDARQGEYFLYGQNRRMTDEEYQRALEKAVTKDATSLDDFDAVINGVQDGLLGTSETLAPTGVEGATFSEQYRNFSQVLLPEGNRPEPQFEKQIRGLLGEFGLQDTLNQANEYAAELRDLEAIKRQRQQYQEGQPTAMGVIAGRVGEIERQENERMDFVRRQLQTTLDYAQTQQSIIGMIAEAQGLDYNAAVQNYDKEFANNLSILNSFQGYKQQERGEARALRTEKIALEDKQRTVAQANLQVLYNGLIDGSMDVNALTQEQKVQWAKLEQQAGLPVGTYMNLVSQNPTQKMLSNGGIRTDAQGNKYNDIVFQDPKTGKISVQSVLLGKDTAATSGIRTVTTRSGSTLTSTTLPKVTTSGAGLSVKGTITQHFGETATNPNGHRGVDISVPKGTSVYIPQGKWIVTESYNGSTQDGYLGNTTDNRGFGNSVVVENMESGERLRFAHLSDALVQEGEVLEGGLIGLTGNTGSTTGAHLHVEYTNAGGQLVDIEGSPYWSFYSGEKASEIQDPQMEIASLSSSEAKAFMRQTITEGVSSSGGAFLGGDGYMSPQDWGILREQWVWTGQDREVFDKNFKEFVNPSIIEQYDISEDIALEL